MVMISVNKMGLLASKIFVNHKEVCKMRNDWKKYVDPKSIVAREAPCGGTQLERILGEDVVKMLNECEQAANPRQDAPEDFESQAGSSAGDSAVDATAHNRRDRPWKPPPPQLKSGFWAGAQLS